jgi:hypothetical protein
VAAFLSATPVSKAALTFDLAENMPSFYGYSTRQITSAGDWVGLGVLDSFGGFNSAGSTFASDANGNLSFSADFTASGSVTYFADIVLTNATSPNPYGIDGINEVHVFYNFTRNSLFNNIGLAFQYPSSPSFIESPASFSAGTNQSVSFQGEDLVGGPLIPNGQSGTLRFLFTAVANSAATRTMELSALSITAVVPEPSSALLLTGVLGLFGSTFRRRRSLSGDTAGI